MASLAGQAASGTRADLSLSTSRLCSSSGPSPGCHRGLSALSGPREGSSSCPSKTSPLSWSHPVCPWGFGTSGEGRKDSLSGGGKRHLGGRSPEWVRPQSGSTLGSSLSSVASQMVSFCTQFFAWNCTHHPPQEAL